MKNKWTYYHYTHNVDESQKGNIGQKKLETKELIKYYFMELTLTRSQTNVLYQIAEHKMSKYNSEGQASFWNVGQVLFLSLNRSWLAVFL